MLPSDTIDEPGLAALVACFYAKVRADTELAPVFDRTIGDWPAHLEKLSAFWSSVMLTGGRYRGNPMAAHLAQAPHITPALFLRWLATAETMPTAAALQAKAARIAASMQHVLAFQAAAAAPRTAAGSEPSASVARNPSAK